MPRTSAADIAKALKGTDFPANTKMLIDQAKKNGAPEDVIKTIKEFPENREYRSLADVEHEFSQTKH